VPDEPRPSLRPARAAMGIAEGVLPSGADEYDVAIIGGGVNGTGVARDLALRGLKVVLFERNDLAFGASGNSSGMIHGGVRYLSSAPHVTEQSCRDSGYIQRIAPHLLFRMPFLMPVKSSRQARVMFELIDAYFRAYDDYQPLKHGKLHCRLDPSELAASPSTSGASTVHDCACSTRSTPSSTAGASTCTPRWRPSRTRATRRQRPKARGTSSTRGTV